MEEVIAHEIGHNVHQQSPAVFQNYQAAAGWEHMDKAALKTRLMVSPRLGSGLTDAAAEAKLKSLEDIRKEPYDNRAAVNAAGKEYRVDPYRDGYLGLDGGSIPTGRDWDYARSNPEDHFAEHYAKAIHAPEGLYKDLKEDPSRRVISAMQKLADLTAPGSGAEVEDFAAAGQVLQQARHNQQARAQQWQIMREDVFHLPQAEVDGKVTAFAVKLSADKMPLGNEFKKKAAMCVTPQQLRELEAEYNAKL